MKIKQLARILALVLFAVLAVSLLSVNVAYAQSGTIDQCADDGDGSNPTCASAPSVGWINGAVTAGKASYLIGDFIAYRQVLQDLTIGYTYCFGFGWDTNINGQPAVDYIGSFDATLTQADPTIGFAQFNVGSPDSTVAIPADPALTSTIAGESFTGVQQAGVITLWGVQDTTFVINGYSNDGTALDGLDTQYQQSLEYCFEASDEDVIIAWGGHIADPAEWGNLPRPTGKAYHASNGTRQGLFTSPRTSETALACVPDDGGDTTNTNIGRQEVQLAVSDPTAVSLQAFDAGSGETVPWTAVSVVGLGALVLVSLLLFSRRRNEAQSL